MDMIRDRIRGKIRIEVFGAYPEALLNAAALSAVQLWELECVNDNTLRMSAYESDLKTLEELAHKCSCELELLSRKGGSEDRKFLRRRWVLLAAGLGAAALLFLSSLFVWDIDVRGNRRLSSGEILRALSDCGLDCGCFWPSLSSDMIRSKMMLLLPDIGWMSVNVSGSRAIVLIEEREPKPLIYNEAGAADIVADRSGIIRRVSVLHGKPQIVPGQAVTEGELLVSGCMDSISGSVRTVYSRAVILADTWYEVNAVCPETEELKEPKGMEHSRWALIFGKRRINLYISSGKAIDGCDKIITEYTLGADGLFALPLRVVRERIVPYESRGGAGYDAGDMKDRLGAWLTAVTDGQILQQSFTESHADGLFIVTLRAHCLENIGFTREIQ